MNHLLDLGTDSPRTMSPERMSDECAKLIVRDLVLGDFNTDRWQDEFLYTVQYQSTFTLAQKKVIYNLAHKFKIL